jgi:hypothetical protein
MSKANLADRGVRHGSVAFHFPYLTHPEQDEVKRFKQVHINEE